jgi:CHAT domain-containing protein
MEAFLEARRLAAASGDQKIVAVLSANISSLYIIQGAFDEAEQSIREALQAIPTDQSQDVARILLLRAQLFVLKGEAGQALPVFRETLAQADSEGDAETFGEALDLLAEAHLAGAELQAADEVLGNAFRLRWLRKEAVPDDLYGTLALLRLAQGNLSAADHFANEAFAAARRTASPAPVWWLYYCRAKVRLAQGSLQEAYRDIEEAFRYTRDLRLGLLPADSIRTRAGIDVQAVSDLYSEIAIRLHLETKKEEPARAAFEAAEQNRAAGLRESLRDSEQIRNRLSTEYWEALRRLTEAEAQRFQSDTLELRRKTERLRHELTELEIEAGLKTPDARHLGSPAVPVKVADIQGALSPSETLFSFILGEADSYLWTLTRDRFEFYRLGDRRRLEAAVRRYRECLQGRDGQEFTARGKRLYQMLFGQVSPAFVDKPDWLLLLDGPLFELPFAGLMVGPSQKSAAETSQPAFEFLAQRHSVRVIPSAAMLLAPRRKQWNGPFVAVGDPVYNTADPRWTEPGSRLRLWWDGAAEGPQFARLAGSAQEVQACAREYRASYGSPVLLIGNRANLHDFRNSLTERPGVIHLATHVVPSPSYPDVGSVAFSLRPQLGPELLGTDTISSFDLRSGLVVMSGCSSGIGALLPAEGLWGLTRAWLRAGARNVAATLWPTMDDSGDLLHSFYRHLGTAGAEGFSVSPAKALQLAQIEMLESGTWRAEPKRWAGYVIFSTL